MANAHASVRNIPQTFSQTTKKKVNVMPAASAGTFLKINEIAIGTAVTGRREFDTRPSTTENATVWPLDIPVSWFSSPNRFAADVQATSKKKALRLKVLSNDPHAARQYDTSNYGLLMALAYRAAARERLQAYAETYRGFTMTAELRGRRLQGVSAGLPWPMWTIVLVGALLTTTLTWFFDMRSQSMHCWMTVMLSALLGLLIFLLAALDNPFRGGISVQPQPFQLMYSRRILGGQ